MTGSDLPTDHAATAARELMRKVPLAGELRPIPPDPPPFKVGAAPRR